MKEGTKWKKKRRGGKSKAWICFGGTKNAVKENKKDVQEVTEGKSNREEYMREKRRFKQLCKEKGKKKKLIEKIRNMKTEEEI